MDPWLLTHLVCPSDHTALETQDTILRCTHGHTYPLLDGIPILLLPEATPTNRRMAVTLDQVQTYSDPY